MIHQRLDTPEIKLHRVNYALLTSKDMYLSRSYNQNTVGYATPNCAYSDLIQNLSDKVSCLAKIIVKRRAGIQELDDRIKENELSNIFNHQ